MGVKISHSPVSFGPGYNSTVSDGSVRGHGVGNTKEEAAVKAKADYVTKRALRDIDKKTK